MPGFQHYVRNVRDVSATPTIFTARRIHSADSAGARCLKSLGPFNSLESRGNYSATSNNTKLVHWPLMGGLLHLVQRGADWAGPQPAQAPPRCTKCNSPSTASVPITVLLYNGPLLCSFNVGIKGLKNVSSHSGIIVLRHLVYLLTNGM